MSTSETVQQPTRSESRYEAPMKVLLPYIVAIGVQIPMFLLYFRNLWRYPHYKTFLFGIIATAAIAWVRWPRDQKMPFHRSMWSNILLFAALLFGLGGVVFLDAWFHGASVMLLIASLLARTVDADSGKSLWTAALPMLVFLQIPLGFDTRLITWLQRVSAKFTSNLLDLIGYGHFMPGTVIKIPGKQEYGIEEACSGVQSFFTLLFVAVVFIVWNRRPWFRSLLLILSAIFWAIFMNTVRIFMIPVADRIDIDLAHGISHAILGWVVMTIGILLLFSTDQFLLFLFGPVEEDAGRSGPFGRFFTTIWNKVLAGDIDKKKRKRGRRQVTSLGKSMVWATAGILGLLSLWQAKDIWASFTTEKSLNVNFFDGDVVFPYEESDLAKQVGDWTLAEYSPSIRREGSDLGRRSDSWIYRAPQYTAQTSLDQTFPGWHELTTCYRNIDWKIVSRVRKSAKISSSDDENDREWDYIEAEFEKKTGERGFLVFSFFDSFAEPVFAPGEWGTLNSFFIRAKNRLSHKIRASLFRAEAYQCQVFVQSFGELNQSTKDDVVDHFLQVREQMRQAYKTKVNSSGQATPAADTAQP